MFVPESTTGTAGPENTGSVSFAHVSTAGASLAVCADVAVAFDFEAVFDPVCMTTPQPAVAYTVSIALQDLQLGLCRKGLTYQH